MKTPITSASLLSAEPSGPKSRGYTFLNGLAVPKYSRINLLTPIITRFLTIATFSLAVQSIVYSQIDNPPRPIYSSPASGSKLDPNPFFVNGSWPETPDYIDLAIAGATPASSVSDANSKLGKRAAAAIFYVAFHNSTYKWERGAYDNEQDYTTAILAKMAFKDYFNPSIVAGIPYDYGDAFRDEANASLMLQRPGKVGTSVDPPGRHYDLSDYDPLLLNANFDYEWHGEYDVFLNCLLTLYYKYYDNLFPETRLHILKDLLTVYGGPGLPYSIDDHRLSGHIVPFPPFVIPFSVVIQADETENHILMIETARYLTNQLRYQDTHDPQFDNNRNGLTEAWLRRLQGLLVTDFREYNSHNYQDYAMFALLNLYSFSYDGRVKLAAKMVLDYWSAKVAVSSNDLRRASPFRRRNEDQHWGPEIAGGFLNTALLFPDATNHEPDPAGAFFALLAGNTSMLFATTAGTGRITGRLAGEMVMAGVLDYRVPDPILDLFVTREHRTFFQGFNHDAGDNQLVTELYSSSPAYLISAGGTTSYYTGNVRAYLDGIEIVLGHDDVDLGIAMPTTFIPTGNGASLEAMIQFGLRLDESTDRDPGRHTGVAPNFACGTPVYIPGEFQRNSDPTIHKDRYWTFVNRGGGPYGYYLAIGNSADRGFLEAYDTSTHLGQVTFDQFITRVLAGNDLTGGQLSGNIYDTQSGDHIVFGFSPDTAAANRYPYQNRFLYGDIMNSDQGSAIIAITNPSLPGLEIELNMQNWQAPYYRMGNFVESSGSNHEVWVDFEAPFFQPEEGDFYHPFKTLASAVNAVADGGMIKMMPGTTSERPVIGKRVTLEAPGGGVYIGVP